MSDVQKRITNILIKHANNPGPEHIHWQQHIAQIIVSELGLTRETGVTDWSTATKAVCTCTVGDDVVDEFHGCERGDHGDETFPVHRYVTEWELAE